jgi:hypothetical protein
MVFDFDEEDAMEPTDEPIPDSIPNENGDPSAEVDRAILSSLVREVTATHLIVWAINDRGGLQSSKIAVSDVSYQVAAAGRVLQRNFEQAIQMVVFASKAFDAATQQWESQVGQSEQGLRANKKAGKLNQVKGKHNQIRVRISPIKSLFRRTILTLQEIEMRHRQRTTSSSKTEIEAKSDS